MAEEVKINTENRTERFVYTKEDVKSIFQYGPTKNSEEKNEKKISNYILILTQYSIRYRVRYYFYCN
jgi:hypothetical protein